MNSQTQSSLVKSTTSVASASVACTGDTSTILFLSMPPTSRGPSFLGPCSAFRFTFTAVAISSQSTVMISTSRSPPASPSGLLCRPTALNGPSPRPHSLSLQGSLHLSRRHSPCQLLLGWRVPSLSPSPRPPPPLPEPAFATAETS
ncbi:hypothetical protein NMY22_g1856 [Coprinellus aureogranulatus]|nr:hypothetical protein NMY22_g1856 [Coprinellus aureogranulatus]